MLVFQYVFTSTAWEMAMTTSYQRSILKIQNQERYLFTVYFYLAAERATSSELEQRR
jgi:hypothetical protein